jgi:hypothetical protein
MHKFKFSLTGLVAATATAGLSVVLSTSAMAAQDVSFVTTGGAVIGATQPAAPGVPITLVGRYSVTGSQTANESGLGVKVKYDAAKFSAVTVTSFSSKCAIAAPQVQTNGASSQVVAGWVETAIRPSGAVGWPGSADIAGTSGCLEVGITQDDGAKSLPFELFRYTFTPVAAYGTATIQLVSEGNISFANAGNTDINKTLTLTEAAAPACNLDVDGNGSRQALVDGLLVLRNMLNIAGTSYTAGVSFPASATRTNEAAVKAFIATNNYDVDGSGTQQALVDGLILLRLMLNISDANLLNGITFPAAATIRTAPAIRANVNARCGTSF